jgi:hypothetical protein
MPQANFNMNLSALPSPAADFDIIEGSIVVDDPAVPEINPNLMEGTLSPDGEWV